MDQTNRYLGGDPEFPFTPIVTTVLRKHSVIKKASSGSSGISEMIGMTGGSGKIDGGSGKKTLIKTVTRSKSSIKTFKTEDNNSIPITDVQLLAKTERKVESTPDNKKELKGLMTDLVTFSFLSDENTNYNFLRLIVSSYEEQMVLFRQKHKLSDKDVFFIYKGGNVLRLVSNDFLAELPSSSVKKLRVHYDKFFKRSDADFSIYLNPDISHYEDIYNDLVFTTYEVQLKIRAEIENSPMKYLQFYKYNDEYKYNILNNKFSEVREASCFGDPKNKTFYEKYPVEMLFDNVKVTRDAQDVQDSQVYDGEFDSLMQIEGKNIAKYNINQSAGKGTLYTTINKALKFQIRDRKVDFSLVRTQIMFNLVLRGENKSLSLVKVPGELIDVSIPRRDHTGIHHVIDNEGENIARYQLTHDDETFSFLSYSIKYFIEDLAMIVYTELWDDPKYNKRLSRLIYFYFIDMFIKKIPNDDKINGLSYLANNINSNPELKKLYSALSNEDLMMSSLVETIIDLNIKYKNSEELEQFKKIVTSNCDILIHSFDDSDTYCSIDGGVTLEALYDGSFSSMM